MQTPRVKGLNQIVAKVEQKNIRALEGKRQSKVPGICETRGKEKEGKVSARRQEEADSAICTRTAQRSGKGRQFPSIGTLV